MNIRDFELADSHILEEMHRSQGFGYTLPRLDSPLWITRKVITDDVDRPVSSILVRLTSEAYFLEHSEGVSPLQRMRRFLALHSHAIEAGQKAGVDSVHVWLPPEVETTFGPQLLKLGWENYIWPTYAKKSEV